MAIKATGRATFTAVEDYDIVFVLNGIRCDVLNFDSVREADNAVLEADFLNGGESCVVDKAVLCCYDGKGSVLGTAIEVHDTSSAIADGGSLYLSKDCKTITCDIYAGNKKLYGKTMPVIRNGSSVGVKAVSYKVKNNVDAGASLNWDSVQSQTTYPTQKPDKGKYCYVMTIVLYTDGTSTNTVSTSYTPNDGVNGTSVKVSSTKVEYAGGDSGTTAPTLGWQTAVPQLAQGQYLWTRTTVSYSDGNSTTSYSVGRIGMDGSKGGTTHILYASSDNPQSPNDVRTTIDATHQYYGTYQDTDLNDDVNKYKSVNPWVLIKGDQGIPGNDGHTPNITIGANGNWYIDDKDSGQKAQGNDGHTPTVTIGTDGYWYIDNTKTSQKAQGETGAAAVQYSVKQLNSTQALVKPSSTGTDATFKLYAYLDFQVNKNVGGTTTNPVITSIKAAADGETWSNSNVGSTEAQLTCNGSTSYTSSKCPPSTLQVEIVCEGKTLYATVPVTIEAGVAIDINNNIKQLQTTVAGKADISTITQKADEISMSIASQKKYRNLLKGTDFSYIPDNMSLNANGEVVEITDKVLYDSSRTVHIKTTNTGHYDGIYMRPITIQTKTAYVFSVWAKGTGKIALETIYQDDSGNRAGRPEVHGDADADLTPEWKLYTVSFTSGDMYTKLECNIWANYVADSEMWIAHPMLEASSQYSGWTLSPDDPTTEQLLVQTGIDIRRGVIDLRAGKVAYLGANGKPYITAELDDEGMPHLIFYNKAGTKMYDLGYTGMFDIIQDSQEQKWVEYSGVLGVGTTISCKDLVPGYAKLSGIWSQVLQGEVTIYEYHSAYFMSSGNEKTYYHQEDNYLLYKSNSIDSSDNNAPIEHDKVFTEEGVPQGFLYEPYGTPSHTESTKNGTTIFNDTRTYYAHDIALDKFMNYSSGGIKVVVQQTTIFIGDNNPQYEYKWRVGSGDWQNGETITTMQ